MSEGRREAAALHLSKARPCPLRLFLLMLVSAALAEMARQSQRHLHDVGTAEDERRRMPPAEEGDGGPEDPV